MPENVFKAVVVLIWLLGGTILFGWFLMSYTVAIAILFAIVFFGVPVLIYNLIKNKKT